MVVTQGNESPRRRHAGGPLICSDTGGAEGIRTPDPFHAITVRGSVRSPVTRVQGPWRPRSSTQIQGGCYTVRYTALHKKWSALTGRRRQSPAEVRQQVPRNFGHRRRQAEESGDAHREQPEHLPGAVDLVERPI
jgi:hypothetical protein